MSWQVECGFDVGFAELFEQAAVVAELGGVAAGFFLDEAFQVTAFVVAGFVVDDPSGAVFVNERAINDSADQSVPSQRAMPSTVNPPAVVKNPPAIR